MLCFGGALCTESRVLVDVRSLCSSSAPSSSCRLDMDILFSLAFLYVYMVSFVPVHPIPSSSSCSSSSTNPPPALICHTRLHHGGSRRVPGTGPGKERNPNFPH